ncbi:RNA-binding protein [Trypanosoma grayi]|uniref:RNA-binding protein n=1 Tax=Trypanosoma grayi TaxID=71804 RepID=UPI0004F477D2|nr:RNA-binding protein [Trypanosoma grayi]KEG10933.1 RNA-binding protein [Trypanosoma grayi]
MGLKKKAPPKKAAAKKAFAEAAADAAKTAVETVTVRAEGKTPRRHVSFTGVDTVKKSSQGESKSTAAAAAARRAATSGIIEAKKRRRDEEMEEAAAEAAAKDEEDDDEEVESEILDSGSEDDLSDLADADDASEASDEAGWENPFEKAKRDGTRLAYEALRLRFLPPEFQEPQLFKFLSQFGATVLNCFCVRSRRTHQSKGVAYVQFDNDAVLPVVVEECHGMSLGGRAVQAHRVTLHRPMPTKEKVTRRRQLAYAYKTRGAPLRRHDVRKKSPIAMLIKCARGEKANNEHLKRLGIDYASSGFAEQLAKVPKHLIVHKKKKSKKSGDHGEGGNGADKKNGVQSTVVSSSLPSAAAAATGKAKQQKVGKKPTGGSGVKTAVATAPAAASAAPRAVANKQKAVTPAAKKSRTASKRS